LEFLVFSTSNWFPHNYCVKNIDLQCKELGRSPNGTIILEHENTIACNFHINSKYKETVQILHNFIKKSFYSLTVINYLKKEKSPLVKIDLKSDNQSSSCNKDNLNFILHQFSKDDNTYKKELDLNHNKREYSAKETAKPKRPTSSSLVFNSRPFSKITRANKISKHVGFNFNNRDMIFVDNNSVSNSTIKTPQKIFVSMKKSTEEINVFGESNLFYNGDVKSIKLIGPPSEMNRISKMLNEDNLKYKYNIEELKKYIMDNDKISSNYLNFVDKSQMDDDDMITYYKAKRRQITNSINDINERSYNHNYLSDAINTVKQKRKYIKNGKIMKKSSSDMDFTQKKKYIIAKLV